jgi:hypothetical protein
MTPANTQAIAKNNPKVDLDEVRKARTALRKARGKRGKREQRFDLLGYSSRPLVPAEDTDCMPMRSSRK